MKHLALALTLICYFNHGYSQRIAPAPAQSVPLVITGGTIHIGNGQVIENGAVAFDNGKITYVGAAANAPAAGATIIDAKSKHVYPGLIAANTYLGLSEIEAVRATNDYNEVGDYNPGTRSLTAYNTDSKVIPTLRSNGILLAQVAPQGGIISGTSSIMQLDGWNWEDAAYLADDGVHLNWPSFFRFKFEDLTASVTVNEDYEKQVQQIRSYFQQAQQYNLQATHAERNINFEALKGTFTKSNTIFIHTNYVREIMNAVQFAKDFGMRMVLVGGRDAYQCTALLKENDIPVILGEVHSLPAGDDEKIDLPYRTAAMLQQAGILYSLSISGFWQVRNLPFMAGTTVAYGVSKEDALKSITSNTAKILGIDSRTGTLETGKDANIIISTGDLLDMKSSNIERAFIQGRDISLDNAQKQLNETY
ncbi:MAG: amidohydrolase family protein, partial [Chitinophagales bacterium]|nr:amidohydrolase family protein [Chitinophagales bacterium]